MTSTMHKRALLKMSGWVVMAVTATALMGCGKTEPDAAPGGASKATPLPIAIEPLHIAFAYIGPVGDAGWNHAHNEGRLAVEREFGDKVKTRIVENVPEGPEAERVIRDLVGQGATLVFGTSFGYMEPMLKVAADHPEIKFEHGTGYKTSTNLRTYDARTYEGAYIAGVIAGSMTRTNILGVVGAIPIPEVIRNINAFTLGAQSVNPRITTKVVWVNDWFDPPKETEAAQSLLNQGADVLLQNTDSAAVLQTAERAGKYAFGWNANMSHFGPKAHLASAVINWGPYYIKATKDVLDGTWSPGRVWWGMKEGPIDLVAMSDVVPASIKTKVETIKSGLKDGSFTIWKGPVVTTEGKVVLAAGEVATDQFLGRIDFYVKGVEGLVPTGK